MHQARILWDKHDYMAIESLFKNTVGYCAESSVWKLNVAHVLFMQESKYKEAIQFYEPIVQTNYDNVSHNNTNDIWCGRWALMPSYFLPRF